jgi:hypothetical protein
LDKEETNREGITKKEFVTKSLIEAQTLFETTFPEREVAKACYARHASNYGEDYGSYYIEVKNPIVAESSVFTNITGWNESHVIKYKNDRLIILILFYPASSTVEVNYNSKWKEKNYPGSHEQDIAMMQGDNGENEEDNSSGGKKRRRTYRKKSSKKRKTNRRR